MNKYLLIFILLLLVQSCKGWEKELSQQGDSNTAIKNAIIDFYHTSSLAHKDKVFIISYKEYDTGIIGVRILGDVNKIYVVNNSPKGRIKDRYFEYKNKLFYWYDEKKGRDPNIIKKLSEYKVLDTVKVLTEDMGYIIDDSKKAAQYYFCKNNMLIYKKDESSIAMKKKLSFNFSCEK